MSKYSFGDDSRDGVLPHESFFAKSALLTCLTYRGAPPLEMHLSPVICLLTLVKCTVDLNALLKFLAAAPNLEHLVLLNALPYMFECVSCVHVSLPHLMELYWFQLWVFEVLL